MATQFAQAGNLFLCLDCDCLVLCNIEFWQHGNLQLMIREETRRCNSGCLVTLLRTELRVPIGRKWGEPPPAPRFLHSTYFWTSARTFPQAASTMVGHIDDHHSEDSPLCGHWRISGWKNQRTCCSVVRVVRSPLPPFLRNENGPGFLISPRRLNALSIAIVTEWTNAQASIVQSQGTLEGEGSDPPRQTNLSGGNLPRWGSR